MNEEDLINLLENGALESQMFNTFYGLAPINKKDFTRKGEIKIYEIINAIRNGNIKRSRRHFIFAFR